MKYLVKYFVVTFFLLVCTYTSTFAEQKIVVLDLKFVLNESEAGKGAQVFLKKSFNDSQKKFQDMEKNLKKKENDLLQKKTILSKEEYQQETDNLRKKVIDYQSQRRAALDKISTQRSQSRETLINTINPIIEDYIKENNISFVIDKKNMIAGTNDYDITQFIVERLNKQLPSLNLK